MTSDSESLWQELTIVNELGLHARSAAKLAKKAQQAAGPVWLELGDARVDAKQVIDILSLAAAQGDRVRVVIEASADIETLKDIAALFSSGFGE